MELYNIGLGLLAALVIYLSRNALITVIAWCITFCKSMQQEWQEYNSDESRDYYGHMLQQLYVCEDVNVDACIHCVEEIRSNTAALTCIHCGTKLTPLEKWLCSPCKAIDQQIKLRQQQRKEKADG